MTLLLLYLFLALTVSFLCSIMEAVLLSTPYSYLKIKEQEGHKKIIRIIHYKQNIEKPLSAILSLNTFAHTVGAAGVGAQAIKVFGDASFGIVSAILTLLILIITEIIPKTIGARYWKKLLYFSANLVGATIIITYPLVVLSAVITRIFRSSEPEQTTSREEISALATIGKEEGIFGEKENKIIQNLIRLKNVRVDEIMTPRVVVAVADENMTLKDFQQKHELMRFSRIPVYAETPENITGYVFRQHIFERLAEDQFTICLKEIQNEIVIVPESQPVYNTWDTLLKRKEHIALVVDEYGGMDGIVTMEDIIETLLGFEIMDETDTIMDMQQYAKKRWKKKQEQFELMTLLDSKDTNT